MLHFDNASTIEKMLRTTVIVLVCASGMIWLNQKSLNEYWAVHFYRESPWQPFASPLWKQGALIMSAAVIAKATFIEHCTDDITEMLKHLLEEANPLAIVKPVADASSEVTGEVNGERSPQNAQQLSQWVLGRNTHAMQLSSDEETFPVNPSLYDA